MKFYKFSFQDGFKGINAKARKPAFSGRDIKHRVEGNRFQVPHEIREGFEQTLTFYLL